jgi:inosine triphosphate pyrophosphatase
LREIVENKLEWASKMFFHPPSDGKTMDNHDSQERNASMANRLREGLGGDADYLLVDAESLEIKALRGFPGPYVKPMIDTLGPDGLWDLMSRHCDRRAELKCALGVKCLRTGEQKIFVSSRSGVLVVPRGEMQANDEDGLQSVFKPEDCHKTLAELEYSERMKISHRQDALLEFLTYSANRVDENDPEDTDHELETAVLLDVVGDLIKRSQTLDGSKAQRSPSQLTVRGAQKTAKVTTKRKPASQTVATKRPMAEVDKLRRKAVKEFDVATVKSKGMIGRDDSPQLDDRNAPERERTPRESVRSASVRLPGLPPESPTLIPHSVQQRTSHQRRILDKNPKATRIAKRAKTPRQTFNSNGANDDDFWGFPAAAAS